MIIVRVPWFALELGSHVLHNGTSWLYTGTLPPDASWFESAAVMVLDEADALAILAQHFRLSIVEET